MTDLASSNSKMRKSNGTLSPDRSVLLSPWHDWLLLGATMLLILVSGDQRLPPAVQKLLAPKHGIHALVHVSPADILTWLIAVALILPLLTCTRWGRVLAWIGVPVFVVGAVVLSHHFHDFLSLAQHGIHTKHLKGAASGGGALALCLWDLFLLLKQDRFRTESPALRRIEFPSLPGEVWALFVVSALSAVTMILPTESLRGLLSTTDSQEPLRKAVLFLVELFQHAGIALFLFLLVLRSPGRVRLATRALLIAALAGIAAALLELHHPGKLAEVGGLMQSRKAYGGYMAVALPILLGCLLSSRKRSVQAGYAVVIFLGLLSIVSGSGFWCALIGLVVTGLYFGRKTGVQAAALCVIAAALVLAVRPVNRHEVVNKFFAYRTTYTEADLASEKLTEPTAPTASESATSSKTAASGDTIEAAPPAAGSGGSSGASGGQDTIQSAPNDTIQPAPDDQGKAPAAKPAAETSRGSDKKPVGAPASAPASSDPAGGDTIAPDPGGTPTSGTDTIEPAPDTATSKVSDKKPAEAPTSTAAGSDQSGTDAITPAPGGTPTSGADTIEPAPDAATDAAANLGGDDTGSSATDAAAGPGSGLGSGNSPQSNGFLTGASIKKEYVEWVAAAYMTASYPWLGVGPGQYQAHIGEYYGEDPNPRIRLEPDSNNLYLVYGGSLGLAGLIALLQILLTATARTWRTVRDSSTDDASTDDESARRDPEASDWRVWWRSPEGTAIAAGVMGALVAFMVVNLFTVLLIRAAGVLFAFLLALASSMPGRGPKHSS